MRSLNFFFVIAALLLIHFEVSYGASSPNMYGLTATNDWTEVFNWIVSVDTDTGDFTNITSTGVFDNVIVDQDGISAFDPINKIYYYATNFKSAVVYYVNIEQKENLGEIDLSLNYVFSLTVNHLTGELFVCAVDSSTNIVVLGVSYPEGKMRTVASLPPGSLSQVVGTFDAKNDIFYMVSVNGTGPVIAAIDSQTGIIKEAHNITCNPGWISNIKFDATDGQIYAGGNSLTLTYFLLVIDPATGACKQTEMPTSGGIVTSYSYDPVNRNEWYALTGTAYLVRAVSVDSGEQVHQIATTYLLFNFEIDPST